MALRSMGRLLSSRRSSSSFERIPEMWGPQCVRWLRRRSNQNSGIQRLVWPWFWCRRWWRGRRWSEHVFQRHRWFWRTNCQTEKNLNKFVISSIKLCSSNLTSSVDTDWNACECHFKNFLKLSITKNLVYKNSPALLESEAFFMSLINEVLLYSDYEIQIEFDLPPAELQSKSSQVSNEKNPSQVSYFQQYSFEIL